MPLAAGLTHELKSCTTSGPGLCLNQFYFILFISHKLVSEQGLGTSKFELISFFFIIILIKVVQDLGMYAGLCLNQFYFIFVYFYQT
jgi:hypothetical protein